MEPIYREIKSLSTRIGIRLGSFYLRLTTSRVLRLRYVLRAIICKLTELNYLSEIIKKEQFLIPSGYCDSLSELIYLNSELYRKVKRTRQQISRFTIKTENEITARTVIEKLWNELIRS